MSVEMIALLMISSLIALIIIGFPIAYSMGAVGIIFGYIFVGPRVDSLFILRIFSVFGDYVILAAPLFIFMGVVIEKAGLAEKLYDAVYIIFGRIRGGLLIATILFSTLFAAATGVIAASIVAMGLLALPTMLKYNYDKSLSTGAICAGGTLGILIPPSVMIVLYGPMAGLSVGRLFMGAFLPGVIMAGIYIVYIYIRCSLNPKLAPMMPQEEFDGITLKEKVILFSTSIVPVGGLIITVLGSIFFGIASPTEAAGIGAFASLILALAYRRLTLKTLKEIVERTLKTAAMIYLILIGAGFFSGVFLRLGGGRVVQNFILGLPLPDFGLILVMFTVVFIMGMFVDWIGIIMIVVPLFTPIAAKIGVDGIWFAMMVMIVLQTSFLSPPFAYSIFFLKGVSPPEIKTVDIYRGVWPFVLMQLIAVILFWVFPQIITWLPGIMF